MKFKKNNLIILDRDGTLNKLVYQDNELRSPRFLDEFKLIEGAKEVLFTLKSQGNSIGIATNQPEVSRKLISIEELNSMHKYLLEEIECIDVIKVCVHDNQDNCICRKPRVGLLEKIFENYNISKDQCYIIGDKWTDVLAGKNFKIKSILIEKEYSYKPTSQGESPKDLTPDFTIHDIRECIKIIL
jgi:D-glycero-D-manno-heptose 1,7-bisphosphate phosphatase